MVHNFGGLRLRTLEGPSERLRGMISSRRLAATTGREFDTPVGTFTWPGRAK